ncbi:MAG: exodeoxyribonuclease VII large subunit [Deltaproteobacteria bacterium]|nr:exodeoxyribonuclease VII large subunit [Deltaproteobacteria bacterium]
MLPRSRRAPAPLTVSQLTQMVRDTLAAELGGVLVAGEISNLHPAASGHLYFTLKDDRSQLRCVLFRSAAQLLVFAPADGQQVVVQGQIGLYPARGDLQLYVDRLEPLGRGALQLAFEQLKERLAAEGLFDEDRKRPLPFFPRHIGIATALGGAALHDILVILRGRCPALHVVIRPMRVQGAGAADDIVRALDDLNAHPALEVLIVGRGGGSLEDLWPFNEERVGRAIVASRLPVVAAIGHEVDFTIACLVADRRAPTPTAAAEMVVPRVADLEARLARGAGALGDALLRRCGAEQRRVGALAARVRDPRRTVRDLGARAASLEARLQRAIGATLRDGRARVAGAAGSLDDLSPLAVLQRGYSLTRRPDGTVVRDAGTLAEGDAVELTFAVGRARARITAPPRSDS